MRILIKIDDDKKPHISTSILATDDALKFPMALILEALQALVKEQEDIVTNKAIDMMPINISEKDIEALSTSDLAQRILKVTIQQCTHIGNGSNYSTHN